MKSKYLTPVYSSLYKKIYTLGVSSKFFVCELAISGIIAFVIKIYFLFIFLFITHIFVAIINKREPMWRDVYKFLVRMPDEKFAELS